MGRINTETEHIWALLNEIPDPEIPAISVVELGVIREVSLNKAQVAVTITPTYSGCPAMQRFEVDIVEHLKNNGFEKVELKTIYNPPWTTDWITEEAKEKLKKYGIAPPEGSANKKALMGEPDHVTCPNCNSRNTEMISQFGSTACKAMWKCLDCLEPFHYFKCI